MADCSNPPAFKDKWRDRFQIEFGVNFYLMPNDTVDSRWRRHLFDPWFKLVRIGDVLPNPRVQLPKFGRGYVDDISNGARDPETNLLKPEWASRCFWLGTGLRLLGLEVGVGVFYRKEFKFAAPTPSPHSAIKGEKDAD